MSAECRDGQPHAWEFGGGTGGRRCTRCGVFGYHAVIRTTYRSHGVIDSQGITLRQCEKTVDGTRCTGWARGHDITNDGGTRRQWRCGEHRTKYSAVG